MQIPASQRTSSLKINTCTSAKYHTFPFQAVLFAPGKGNAKNGTSQPGLQRDMGQRSQKT